MDQLFKALPQDLQWEVLSEFAGTHSVRKGKLIRKLVLDSKFQMVMNMNHIQPVVDQYNIGYVHAIAFVRLHSGRKITCYQDERRSSDVRYIFNRPGIYSSVLTTVVPAEDSAVLPPFEKHSYPSYEHTDKKKETRFW